MEWALWRAFTLGRSVAHGPPPIFKTRIKRLLDIDRTFEAGEFHGASAADFAFGGPERIRRQWPELHGPFVDPDAARETAVAELGADRLLPPAELARILGWPAANGGAR